MLVPHQAEKLQAEKPSLMEYITMTLQFWLKAEVQIKVHTSTQNIFWQ